MNNNKQICIEEGTQTAHRISLHEQEVGFQARPDVSVLVSMERAGQHLIAVGCRGGGCGQCRIRILQGDYFSKRMSRAWISSEQESEGTVLACRVFARSDLLIEPDPPEVGSRCQAAAQHDQ